MARAHAADACAQSDSIKGLAQSIAKPAYTRLLTAEPTLRRAVPTLIIAFLVTICLGAFVQVLDQSRQKRASAERDITAPAARHIIVVTADNRILARVPIEATPGEADGILDAISSAQLLATPSKQG